MKYVVLVSNYLLSFFSLHRFNTKKDEFLKEGIDELGSSIEEVDNNKGIIYTQEGAYTVESYIERDFDKFFLSFKDYVELFFIKYHDDIGRLNGYKKSIERALEKILRRKDLFIFFPYANNFLNQIIDYLNEDFDFKFDKALCSTAKEMENKTNQVVIPIKVVPKKLITEGRNINTLTLKSSFTKDTRAFNKLYVYFKKERIIDGDTVPKHIFVRILRGKETEPTDFINFTVNNALLKNILTLLGTLYTSFDAGIIERYGKFKTKQGTLMTQNNYNRTKTTLSQEDSALFERIKNTFKKYFPTPQ